MIQQPCGYDRSEFTTQLSHKESNSLFERSRINPVWKFFWYSSVELFSLVDIIYKGILMTQTNII